MGKPAAVVGGIRTISSRNIVVAHRTAAVVSVLVIGTSLAALIGFVVFEDAAEEFTSGLPPIQFYRGLSENRLDDYGDVFAVAHNSGDRLGTTVEAIAHGADVIEIDVVSMHGRLYAAHSRPLPFLGPRAFRGPTLGEVWNASARAGAVKLDLKQSSAAFYDLVFAFLDAHRDGRPVIVVSSSPSALRAFQARAPDVYRFINATDANRQRALQRDPELLALIDGVSVRHDVLDADIAAWFDEQGVVTMAWTVNDLKRVNELVKLGVDAITTDNLAIMELLGDRDRGAAILARRSAAQPGEQPTGQEPEDGGDQEGPG